ncbi:MAG: thiamine phosphate synthase, partial [Firmicutes bacterium]|nr:thiamine phosphate synthase [Bacillota bacterium]
MIFDKDKLLVYAITDRILLSEKEKIFFNRVEEVLKSGIKCLQFRNKDISREDFFRKAIVLRDLCKKYNALFIINDEVEIAIKIKADGVHVGQEDMEAQKARKMIGKDMILGVSCENLEQAI